MLGEIIAVGEEVLAGDVINSNAAVLSRKLAEIGIFCRHHSVVGDDEVDIVELLGKASERSQFILLSGGLGPTKDDLTKEAVASFLGRNLYESAELKEEIKEWFSKRNYKISKNNFKQALMIEGGQPLHNNNGTAPGVYVCDKGVHYFLLPGPPGELIPMYDDFVKPIIEPLREQKIISKTFKLINIGESQAVTILDDLMTYSESFILAPYAKLGEVHLKATAIGKDEEILSKRIAEVEKIIRERLGDYIYSSDSDDLPDKIIGILKSKGLTFGGAESCTGGMLADMFVSKPGVSSVFMESAITYSNDSKIRVLGVSEKTLNKYGAVSEETAREMVIGVMERFKVDVGISITGIAGPDGGTIDKPVGLVYMGIGFKGEVWVFEDYLGGNRDKIRQYAAKRSLIRLYNKLKEVYPS